MLASGIDGYEAAKTRANDLRKQYGLKWEQVKFRSERGSQSSGGSGGSTAAAPKKQFGVSQDGKTLTNTSGQSGRVDFARHYNPSKGRRFRGYTDAKGNYHDIDWMTQPNALRALPAATLSLVLTDWNYRSVERTETRKCLVLVLKRDKPIPMLF